jgi:hypothetical protein
MPKQPSPDTDLTPEAIEVLNGILEETEKLREVALLNTAPAAVFEAD